MLYVANADRPELRLPAPPPATLWVGGILGVCAIPLYAGGYRAAARGLAEPRAARLVALAGTLTAVVGTVTHGLTAASLAAQLESKHLPREPLQGMLSSGPLLLGLWAIGTVLVLVASAAFVWAVSRRPGEFPVRVAWLNPALLTIALGLAAAPVEMLRAFLLPAAPNLAHCVFFAACAWTWRAARPVRG